MGIDSWFLVYLQGVNPIILTKQVYCHLPTISLINTSVLGPTVEVKQEESGGSDYQEGKSIQIAISRSPLAGKVWALPVSTPPQTSGSPPSSSP